MHRVFLLNKARPTGQVSAVIMETNPIQMTPNDFRVLNTDFAVGDVRREHVDLFGRIHRGSVRLMRGLFRTRAEQEDYVERGLHIKLPGQKFFVR